MKKKIYADLLLIFITIVWGFSIPLMRNTLSYIPNQTYLFYRFLLASIILTGIFRKKLRKVSKLSIIRGMIVGTFLAGTLLLTVYALNYTTASNVSFISGLNIITVPVLSSIFLKQRLNIRGLLGIFLASFGLFLISGGFELSFNFGDFLALLCAIFLTLQILFIDIYGKSEDPFVLGTIQIYTATGIYFLVLCVSGVSYTFERGGLVLFTIILTGVISTALAFVGQTYVQQFTSPLHVAIIFILEPVFGAVFSSLLPNSQGIYEVLGKEEMIGGFVLVIAMLIVVMDLNHSSVSKT